MLAGTKHHMQRLEKNIYSGFSIRILRWVSGTDMTVSLEVLKHSTDIHLRPVHPCRPRV